ncbi:hypothetical protein NG895_06445 [Aeoliella sp. ICT_H6.2]|uniref:Uncharacterized protein n=1 Tax=Aeoliella straminimaris TaxID=2954799 RepID=A0A9X2JFQ7_9BACT|nr:hypothetical protein [Aeoliella straminimaris]MCO6043542.1 hypothetical protein [Aeoliella straminimaris]
METLLALLGIMLAIAVLVGYGWCGAWVVRDARRHGELGWSIAVLVWMFGPLAAAAWWFARPKPSADSRQANCADANDSIRERRLLQILIFSGVLAIVGVVGCVWIASNIQRVDRTAVNSRAPYTRGAHTPEEKDSLLEFYLAFRIPTLVAIFGGALGVAVSLYLLRQVRARNNQARSVVQGALLNSIRR